MRSIMKINIFVILALVLFPISAFSQGFTEDPLPNTTSGFIFNQFMQLDNISPQSMHTGIDVGVVSEDVYPGIPSSETARVQAVGADYVVLVSQSRMNGDYAVAQYIHINPESTLVVGSNISSTTKLGVTNGQNHLHFELFLSNDTSINDADLRNPQRYALNNAHFTGDNTDPIVSDDIIVHNSQAPAGDPMVWEVFACDEVSGVNNAIAGMELQINNNAVDIFDFDGMLDKNGAYPPDPAHFYYNTNNIPSGNNNPNVLAHKLIWISDGDTSNDTWRLRLWDSAGNEVLSPEFRFTAAEFGGQFAGTFVNGRVRLNWRIVDKSDIDHFNVYQSTEEYGRYERVNSEPIPAVDGRLDYDYLITPPSGAQSVWYKIAVAPLSGGGEYMLSEKANVSIPLTNQLFVSPNPQKSGSTFSFMFNTKARGQIEVDVYDIRGRKVRAVYSGAVGEGMVSASWDGKSDDGSPASAGVYAVRVKINDEVFTRKIALVK